MDKNSNFPEVVAFEHMESSNSKERPGAGGPGFSLLQNLKSSLLSFFSMDNYIF